MSYRPTENIYFTLYTFTLGIVPNTDFAPFGLMSLIGVSGTVLGVIIGMLFVTYINEIQWLVEYILGSSIWNEEIRFLAKVPARLRIEDVVFTLTVSLSISFVITIFPARRAANLDPAEALKYE